MFHCIFFTHKHDLCINNTKSLVIIESKHPFREISTDKNTNRHQRHKNYSRISVPFPPKVKSNAALREIRCRTNQQDNLSTYQSQSIIFPEISRTHNFQSIHSERFQAQNHDPGITGTRITRESAFNSYRRSNLNAALREIWCRHDIIISR